MFSKQSHCLFKTESLYNNEQPTLQLRPASFMNPPQSPVEDIPEFILRNVEKNPRTITRLVMGRFAMTRPAAMQHVNRLIAAGQLIASGSTRDRKYSLALLTDATSRFPITPQLREDSVWRDSTRPHLDSVPQNVLEVCQYGLTEMVSNVVDHSEGQAMVVAVRRSAAHVRIMVHDDGIGIFNKISRDLNLGEPRHAILELAKGKLTTDPTRHTGEGIFFTSRMFEGFSILSDGLFFSHTQPTDDWLIEHDKQASGTMIVLEISPMATTTTKQVFDRYSPEDADYAFTRTHVPVALARYGDERLVSRVPS